MAKCKGTNIVFLRKVLGAAGTAAESQFLEKLTPAEAESYRTALPVSWLAAETTTRLFEAAAEVLHPGDAQGIRRLGRELARDNLKGIYRALLRMTTISFVVGLSARLWGMYHDQGKASAWRDPERNRVVVTVTDYPELPKKFLDEIAGYIFGVAEFTGVKNLKVEKDAQDPRAWKWSVTWG